MNEDRLVMSLSDEIVAH